MTHAHDVLTSQAVFELINVYNFDDIFSRLGYREDVSSHSKKSKKRSNKKNNVLGSWMSNTQNNQSNDTVPGMEYPHLLWQSNIPQNFQNNGQRLFTTTSDPSMCGYTQMPMTYTMEPVSLPTMYRVYQPVPVSGIRTVHSRHGRQCDQNQPMNLSMNSMANGYTSLQENGGESPVSANCQNGDYTSLPSTANKNNGINGDEINSEHRRYSDPGLGSAEAAVHGQSEDSDSVDSGSSITTIGRSNKLVLSLIEQMTELKKSNNQLFNELNETKSEIGSMKAKLAVCSSSDYQPGMLSDFIREIRQANKTYEEVLVSKVKSMIEEKLNQRSLEVVNLNVSIEIYSVFISPKSRMLIINDHNDSERNQIMKLMEEKKESDRRIAKLEEEVATLKLNANNEGREIAAFEEETLALRRELQEARASKCLAETNHVAKCVNAASVTPVATFDTTQSYVTSTPVRTALSDTCSLIPAPPSSTSSFSSMVPQHFTSSLCSRTADLAQHLVTDKTNVYRAGDCSSPTTSINASWSLDDQALVTSSGNQSPVIANNSTSSESRHQDVSLGESSNISGIELTLETRSSDQHEDEDSVFDDQNLLDELNLSWKKIVPEESVARDDDLTKSPGTTSSSTSSVQEKRIKESRKELELSRGDLSHHQRVGSKKSRKKKGGSLSKRSFSETDKGGTTSGERNEIGTKDTRRTVSEDEDRSRRNDDVDDETSRAITEIPEVTVVGGGSFVPKDLCSTGILTSRVLTAPSRATYTTAYI
ncbi:hypothetical protein WN51_02638 [Melipona quadrifasciata]|uniref:Uncharacterized protein n=1 Tax=Melipona quadrifasciata TaxID=166423 RepID=A0A0N0U3U3_9HYME|nr:hypothetical protein WN51_02638 [Melipona quadrifasciata]